MPPDTDARSIPTEAAVLDKLTAWARAQDDIRAVLLTSSRARPAGPVDVLSDYDVVLAVRDPEAFTRGEGWLSAYGRPVTRWGDQGELLGAVTRFCGVVYADFVKIDYTVWPAGLLAQIAAAPALPTELDAGYRVLLDKDGATAGWAAPTGRGYVPQPPSAADYDDTVQEFWWTATYVAKSLWRGEPIFARFCLDHDLRLTVVRRVLEWGVEIERGWAWRPGVWGRGLERQLSPDVLAHFARTYGGLKVETIWANFFDLIALFRRVARDVGQRLGYTYPQAVDDEVSGFIAWVRCGGV